MATLRKSYGDFARVKWEFVAQSRMFLQGVEIALGPLLELHAAREERLLQWSQVRRRGIGGIIVPACQRSEELSYVKEEAPTAVSRAFF